MSWFEIQLSLRKMQNGVLVRVGRGEAWRRARKRQLQRQLGGNLGNLRAREARLGIKVSRCTRGISCREAPSPAVDFSAMCARIIDFLDASEQRARGLLETQLNSLTGEINANFALPRSALPTSSRWLRSALVYIHIYLYLRRTPSTWRTCDLAPSRCSLRAGG